jgi:tetratricopeptide (TPR) repeat protein
LARAYMALGDYKKAAEYAQKAAVQAPDPVNKKNLEAMAKTLAEGKPYDN